MKSIKKIPPPSPEEPLFQDLSTLIERSRRQVAVVANSTVVMLYWQIGRRINTEILQNKRAVYGRQIVPAVAARLEQQYGRSFREKASPGVFQIVAYVSWNAVLAYIGTGFRFTCDRLKCFGDKGCISKHFEHFYQKGIFNGSRPS